MDETFAFSGDAFCVFSEEGADFFAEVGACPEVGGSADAPRRLECAQSFAVLRVGGGEVSEAQARDGA